MSDNKKLPIPQRYKSKLNELLMVKYEMRKLADREKELKFQLSDYVKSKGSIKLSLGRLEYRENVLTQSFNRNNTLDFIKENLGDEAAELVDENCTIDRQNEGIWVFLNKRDAVFVDSAINTSPQEISEVIQPSLFDTTSDDLFGDVVNG